MFLKGLTVLLTMCHSLLRVCLWLLPPPGAGDCHDSHVHHHPGSFWLDSGSPGGLQEEVDGAAPPQVWWHQESAFIQSHDGIFMMSAGCLILKINTRKERLFYLFHLKDFFKLGIKSLKLHEQTVFTSLKPNIILVCFALKTLSERKRNGGLLEQRTPKWWN